MLIQFFLLLSTALLQSADSRQEILLSTKHGVIHIEVESQLIKLRIQKDDGTDTTNVLRTKTADNLMSPLEIDENCEQNSVCIRTGNLLHTIIRVNASSEIINIERQVPKPDGELVDCYAFGKNVQWFGGPQLRFQRWPIQDMYYEEEPYLPTHPVNMALSERYWLSSKGIYITVNDSIPLFLDQNHYKDKNLCLIAKNKAPYQKRPTVILKYEIGVFPNPREAHKAVISRKLGKPVGIPNLRMIRYPIWSTWARYKANVSDTVVRKFADEILAHNFNNSQLEIDDNWETCYGSAEFDSKKFPNVTGLITDLKKKGFRVTLWIHPFINENCEPAYTIARSNSYFVKNLNGSIHTQWWQGLNAAVVDFTNSKAVVWWVERLKKLQSLGIDSFKFDAGEVSWLPEVASLTGDLMLQPGIYTRNYVKVVANNFDDNIEVRVGWGSQNLPIFVRMIDKDSSWSWNNGLPTLITTLIQMNLNGYVHVLPDMIGGNGYLDGSLNGTVYPSKELFIRWLQANVFMPSLQYSFVPWDFDNETLAISKNYTDLHSQVTNLIEVVMRDSVKNGTPVNPPIWWVDPSDEEAFRVNDEFLLGDYILVAPVIEEGAESRDIYLPEGEWLDGTGKIYLGKRWIKNYKAPLNVLPFFIRISNYTSPYISNFVKYFSSLP
ncbi:myogenesis-regulating glycosidase [Prorops nasuta]|uniref:myogenesis-regulating glycosidase n=1 Tax=Prorops nasuta TaxID=863751 RepID=UPI0034CDBCAA